MELRIKTLTESVAPIINSITKVSPKLSERPKTMVAAPNAATEPSSLTPAWRRIGACVKYSAPASAPTVTVARKMPKPTGPTSNMSLA